MRFNSLKSQLFFTFGGLAVVISLLYHYLGYQAVALTESITAGFLLDAEAAQLSERYQLTGLTGTPSYPFYHYITDREKLPACDTLKLPHDTAITVFRCSQASYYVYRLELTDNKPLWLVLNATEVLPLSRFGSVILGLFITVAVLAATLTLLAVWWLTARLVRPLQLLTQAVITQADNGPDHFVGTARKDEIGQLARAFKQTYGELQQAMQREQDFTTDVSHELRTSVTLMKNTLAVYQHQTLPADALHLLQQTTSELQQTIDVLLALARKDNVLCCRQALLPVLEQVVLAVNRLDPECGFAVTVQVGPEFQVNGNPYLIYLLCQNLVHNGFYHGAGQGMTIQREGYNIVFVNPLDGQPRQPYYQGLGHGQYLVNRIAGVLGWQLAFDVTAHSYIVRLTPA